MIPPDKTMQSKPSSKQTHVFCTGRSQESCWFVHIDTPPEHSPGEEGEGSAGLRCLCQPQCQAPCAAPTDLPRARHAGAATSAPSPFPKWAQRQVKSELTQATSWSALQFQPQIRENLFLGLFLLNHKSQSIARVADYLTERFPKNFAGM